MELRDLQWLMQKTLLNQDVFLIGMPGEARLALLLKYLVSTLSLPLVYSKCDRSWRIVNMNTSPSLETPPKQISNNEGKSEMEQPSTRIKYHSLIYLSISIYLYHSLIYLQYIYTGWPKSCVTKIQSVITKICNRTFGPPCIYRWLLSASRESSIGWTDFDHRWHREGGKECSPITQQSPRESWDATWWWTISPRTGQIWSSSTGENVTIRCTVFTRTIDPGLELFTTPKRGSTVLNIPYLLEL